jgi:CDP-diglyceride synthetase
MPSNRQVRFFVLLIACAFLGLLEGGIRPANPALQLIVPVASVFAFALILVMAMKALPARTDELPLRRVAIILIAAVAIPLALFSALRLLGPSSGPGWHRNAPLAIAFAAFAFILYRNFVLRPGKKP